MATTFTTTTFSNTYKDDFRDSDNYHRILFNSGKALQARELTQLQTIIQKELARLGSNLFKEGAVVQPAGASLDQFEFIKLASGQLPSDTASMIGKTFTVAAPAAQIKVQILDTIAASGSDPDTLVVKYVDTSAGTSGASAIRVGNTQTLQNSTLGSAYDMVTASSGASGKGLRFSVGEGVIYAQEHFIFVEKQTIYLSKYSTSFEGDVGYKITQDVVTVDDTTALYDNQGSSPNLAAPGADRYRIRLTLIKRADLAATDNFVFLLKVKDGDVVTSINTTGSYNEINNLLALRTKEESGNYISTPIYPKFSNNTSTLNLQIPRGVFYINGYRVEIPPTTVSIPKAQDTVTKENESINIDYGNYVVCDHTDNKGIPNINYSSVNIRSAADYGGSTIGTANVRAIRGTTSPKVYLFNIQMSGNNSFASARSLGTSASDYMNITLEDGYAVLKDTSTNDLLMPLPSSRPQQTTQSYDEIEVQKRYTFHTAVGGTVSGIPVVSGTFEDTDTWIASGVDSSIDNLTFSLNGARTAFDVSGGADSQDYEVLATVKYTSPTARSKTLISDQELTIDWATEKLTDAAGNNYIDLLKTDIFKVKEIKFNDTNGADISSNFIIDNGQRDNFYGFGRLVQRGGTTIPANATIYIKFDWLQHGTSGYFFDVSSYDDGDISYDQIPSHTQNDGTVVSLRDVIDFRPSAAGNSASYTFDSNGNGADNFLLPRASTSFTGDIIYYEPRKDRLVATIGSIDNVNISGEYKLVSGVSDLVAQYPKVPNNTMNLIDISLNPYTLNDSDLTINLIQHKKYQMKDIANLENRVNNLEELTTLSLLELNTSTLSVIDSAGNPRTKAGFLVDNFKDDTFSAIGYDAFSEKDAATNTLTCGRARHDLSLQYKKNDAATTTSLFGDYVMLPVDSDISFINQDLCTETINVNPFNVITNSGTIKLSPSEDRGISTDFSNAVISLKNIQGRNISTSTTFHNLSNASAKTAEFTRTSDRFVYGVSIADEYNSDEVYGKQEFITKARSKKVYFEAHGLRPYTKHFAWLDSQDMTDYIREESSFVYSADAADDISKLYPQATSHPDGATDLTSDSSGVIIGSFIIPSEYNFPNGKDQTLEFKLLDISANNNEDATSKAAEDYYAIGQKRQVLSYTQNRVWNTKTINRVNPPSDPVAQTFWVNSSEYPEGLFVTKADIFFASKPASDDMQSEVICEIREVENGVPVSGPMYDGDSRKAQAILAPNQVTTTATSAGYAAVQAAPTTFTFTTPVYLAPDKFYAIVVKCDASNAYNVYVAKTYDFLLGSTEKRVSKQANNGSLFASQNGYTWSPDQTKDLMFNLYRAKFSSSATAIIENYAIPSLEFAANATPFLMDSADATVRVFQPGHGFSVNSKVNISGIGEDSDFAGISGSSLLGTRTVTSVDYTGYTFEADSAANGSYRTGSQTGKLKISENILFDNYHLSVPILNFENTLITSTGKLTLGESFAEKRTGSTRGYAKASSYTPIALNETVSLSSPRIILSDSNEDTFISGNKSLTLKLDLSSSDSDYRVSPVINASQLELTGHENVIDRQINSATTNYNVPISYVAETHPTGGSAAAKHVTSSVSLTEQAVGLKILFAANRPADAEFEVYYKIATADENLNEINWVEVAESTNNPADENKEVYREYEYLAGGTGGNLTAFTQFQVKIVMNTINSSKIPTIKDLRTIAMVT